MAVEATAEQGTAPDAAETTETGVTEQLDTAGASQTQLVSPGSDLDVSSEAETGDVDGSVAQPEQTDAVDDSGIGDDLASLASSYGLNPAGFGSRANLENAIATLDRQAAQLVQKFQPQRDPETGRFQAGQQGQVNADGATQAEQKAAFDLKKLLTESFGGEEYDQGVEKVLAGLHGHWSSQLQPFQQVLQHLPALVEKVQQFDAFLSQQQQAQAETELDGLFAAKADYHDMFGKDPIQKLPRAQQQARNALVEEMLALDLADQHRGRQSNTRAQLFERALRSLHGERTETIVRKQVATQLNGNKNRALSRPAKKSGQPVSGVARAIERLNKWSADRGLTVPDYGDDE